MHVPKVLVVDDQPENLDVLVSYLSNCEIELMVATEGEQALALANDCPPDLALLDVMMPGMDGFSICENLKSNELTAETSVIFLSALTDIESKLKGFKAGAIDFISKPLQRDEVLARIEAHLTIRQQRRALQQKNEQLESLNRELQEQIDKREQAERELQIAGEKLSSISRQEAQQWGLEAFIGTSSVMRALVDELKSLQAAPATNVLVLGESGTGKELISRAIHFGSARNSRPFVAVNCAAIPMELADAEFFGHVKGAFTGAASDRHGYFVQADGGTLFLDEIGDMPLSLQAKLLRVLEDGWVTQIGGKRAQKVDVRVVAATNVNIQERVQAKQFRQDLFFRLAGYQVSLPPLRERASDIGALVEHFIDVIGRQMGREFAQVDPEVVAALRRYAFPGNVRELRNMMEYALIASRGGTIRLEHLRFASDDGLIAAAVPKRSVAEGRSGDEQSLIDFARSEGRVDNTSVQDHLGVDHGRASYLLKKLHREGRLLKQGERRWAWYSVP